MRHRGPDDDGEWWAPDGRVGLGHRRLAIIDLSSAGHQPMLDATGELCIVFNGEIYNFDDLRAELVAKGVAFRSNSDVEVILASYRKWGTHCLTRLNGMFAFALCDKRQERLFITLDRAGEKPLFYALEKDSIRLASELKGLMADPDFACRIDPEALDCYLAEGFAPDGSCILQGVRKLPPAHALVFDLNSGKSRLWPYWQLSARYPSAASSRPAYESALLDELEAVMEEAVRR